MVTDNLLEFLDDIQKLALKVKVQNILDTLVKDDRVHDVLNADTVIEYYNKMYEHYERSPKDFLFPNRKWLTESLERLDVDLSNVFDEGANPNHVKREEITILFMLLWINMKVQGQSSPSPIKSPYDLFSVWVYDRVLIIRPTNDGYLRDGDNNALTRCGNNYGWFTNLHSFVIYEKGEVEYSFTDPHTITSINSYTKESIEGYKKVKERATDRLVREQNNLADGDKRHWEPEDRLRKPSRKVKMGWSANGKPYIAIPYNSKKAIKDSDIIDAMTKLNEDLLKEEERRKIIRHRNTKFVVREMSGLSNKEYKQLLEAHRVDRYKKAFDPYIKEVADVLAKDYGINVDSDIISYAKRHARPKHNSPFQTVAIIDIINAMIKLKERLNEEKDQ